jgi:microcystin-dependent protein
MNETRAATAWVAQTAPSTTRLTYALQVDPAPLTVSLSQEDPQPLALRIVVTNATGADVTVGSITFSLPIGEDATDLTWTTDNSEMEASNETEWGCEEPPLTTSGQAPYVLQPATGPSVVLAAGASVTVGIFKLGAGLTPGTSTIGVTEVLSTGKGATSFAVTTFPYGFYFNQLTASVLEGSVPTPVAQVALNQTVTLSWNSSVVEPSAYEIYYSDAVKGQTKVTPEHADSWTSLGLTSDTTFVVAVQVKLAGGVPLTAVMSVTVSVQNPALIASSATVSGPVKATGVVTGVGLCPPGTVIMFHGEITNPANFEASGAGVKGSPYEGWQLCNGQNGSPDLRDRFIAGAGGSYIVGQTGGQDSVAISVGQMPAHEHNGWTGSSAPTLNYPGVHYCSEGVTTGIMVNVQTEDPNGYRPNMLTTRGEAEIQVNPHNHQIPQQGSGQAHENRPQFTALAYLMRT